MQEFKFLVRIKKKPGSQYRSYLSEIETASGKVTVQVAKKEAKPYTQEQIKELKKYYDIADLILYKGE